MLDVEKFQDDITIFWNLTHNSCRLLPTTSLSKIYKFIMLYIVVKQQDNYITKKIVYFMDSFYVIPLLVAYPRIF